MDHWELRARAIAGKYSTALIMGFVVLALLGGFLTFSAYGQPNTQTETVSETVSSWNSTGQFFHQATVIDGSRAFPEGSSLSNRTVYFGSVAPELDGTFVYNYTASESGSLSTDASVTLVVRSVRETEDGNETEIWSYEEPIDEVETTLSSGETVRISFSENMSAIQDEIAQIESQIGGSAGSAEAVFISRVHLDGTRNGVDVDQIRTYQLPVTFQGTRYQVEDPGPTTHQDAQTVENEVTSVVPASPLERFGGPLFVVLGLAGLGAVITGRRIGWLEISEYERDYLAFLNDRNEFDEWITTARLPTDLIADSNRTIQTTTLSGLADLAIDMDRRVIEIADSNLYVVIEDDTVYSYESPLNKVDNMEHSGDGEDKEDGSAESGSQLWEKISTTEQEDRTGGETSDHSQTKKSE